MTEEAVVTIDSKEDRSSERCVFQAADGTCERLNNTECGVGGCSFLILPEEEERKRELWMKRLCSLEESKQREISKKYYGGSKPWRVQ